MDQIRSSTSHIYALGGLQAEMKEGHREHSKDKKIVRWNFKRTRGASIHNRNLEQNRHSERKLKPETKHQDSRNCTQFVFMCLALRPHSSPVRQMSHIFLETNRLPWSKWLANIHITSNGECRGLPHPLMGRVNSFSSTKLPPWQGKVVAFKDMDT